ncbi:Deoxyadenosine/deoxycytidine kinase [Blastococcus aurantiacus]|uniref:Deoxyadenosine/deoxycytidine kinase n=1 Tax=Blastococcus aurantiacus TaxID=1550231 RepID=A0A1G7J436_9ACTN|nr:deoxynucleoside kinase [Blastococcus aurantiacus]SDF19651.1 Deoxyadenosine/deoxycytidine kinase [Blastococcus aurantiacus]
MSIMPNGKQPDHQSFPQARRRYVVVTGSIGAGASTLAQALIDKLGWQGHLEGHVEEDNAFFADSYLDFPRWGFASQVHFLLASVHRHDALRSELARVDTALPDVIVEDRTPFEHSGAYLAANESLGRIPLREAQLLRDLTRVLERSYLVPDLLVFRQLTPAQARSRVAERDRPGEGVAGDELLEAIRQSFDGFVDRWKSSPKFIVPAEADVREPDTRDRLVGDIAAALDSATTSLG